MAREQWKRLAGAVQDAEAPDLNVQRPRQLVRQHPLRAAVVLDESRQLVAQLGEHRAGRKILVAEIRVVHEVVAPPPAVRGLEQVRPSVRIEHELRHGQIVRVVDLGPRLPVEDGRVHRLPLEGDEDAENDLVERVLVDRAGVVAEQPLEGPATECAREAVDVERLVLVREVEVRRLPVRREDAGDHVAGHADHRAVETAAVAIDESDVGVGRSHQAIEHAGRHDQIGFDDEHVAVGLTGHGPRRREALEGQRQRNHVVGLRESLVADEPEEHVGMTGAQMRLDLVGPISSDHRDVGDADPRQVVHETADDGAPGDGQQRLVGRVGERTHAPAETGRQDDGSHRAIRRCNARNTRPPATRVPW